MEVKVLEYNRIFTEMVKAGPNKWRRATLFSAGYFVPMLACIEKDMRTIDGDDWEKDWFVLDPTMTEAQGIRWTISWLDDWKRSEEPRLVNVN